MLLYHLNKISEINNPYTYSYNFETYFNGEKIYEKLRMKYFGIIVHRFYYLFLFSKMKIFLLHRNKFSLASLSL